jgi:bifunctional DNase/RNase
VIRVSIDSLSMDVTSNQPVVLLRSGTDNRVLPIWIGHNEATAILLRLQGVEPPRPLTHDLLVGLLDTLCVEIERIVIDRLEQGTFYATIHATGGGHDYAIDARPSDSIALAVRVGAPIFVDDEVMEEAGLTPEETVDEEAELERFREFLDSVHPEDFDPTQR